MDWNKTPMEIVNAVDDEMKVSWDTDSEQILLAGFIQTHCNQTEFEAYVRKVAAEDVKATQE